MFTLKFFGDPVPFRGVRYQALVNLWCVLKFEGPASPKGRNTVSRKMQLGWVKRSAYNFFVCGPKFTFFLRQTWEGLVDQLLFRFWISWPIPEILAIKLESCLKSCVEFSMFWAPNFFGGGPPNFWTCIIKRTQIVIMWQSFTAIGRGSSEVARQKQ